MGSWGYAALEDDTALDFIGGFSDAPSVDKLREVLTAANEAEYIDDYSGPQAMAAAEVVAAMNGKPFAKLNESVAAWAAQQGPPDAELKTLAATVVQQVFEESELRDIWEDSGAIEPWGEAIEELKSRLA